MSIREVDQGIEKEVAIAFEAAMDVRDVVIAFPTEDGPNAEGIRTKSTLAIPVNQRPRDWTHLLLRVAASDGRSFFMLPAGDNVDSIVSNRKQYTYDAVSGIIHASGLEATDTVTFSAMTVAGSHYCPLSYVNSFDITDGKNRRAIYDRKTLMHYKEGNPALSGSCSQKFVDFFEPENVRQLFSCARNITEIYAQDTDSGTFGIDETATGPSTVWNTPLRHGGVDDSPMVGSINFVRTPTGIDLAEAEDATDLASADGKFMLSVAEEALTANGQVAITDNANIVGGKPISKTITVSNSAAYTGSHDTVDMPFNVGNDVLTVQFSAGDIANATKDTVNVIFAGPATADGVFEIDVEDDDVPGTILSGVPHIAVYNGDSAATIATRAYTAIAAVLGAGYTASNAVSETLKIERDAVGSVAPLSVGAHYVDDSTQVTEATIGSSIFDGAEATKDTIEFIVSGGPVAASDDYEIDVLYDGTSLTGGVVATGLVATETDQESANRIVTAIGAVLDAAWSVDNASGTSTTITVSRDTAGANAGVGSLASFAANTTGLNDPTPGTMVDGADATNGQIDMLHGVAGLVDGSFVLDVLNNAVSVITGGAVTVVTKGDESAVTLANRVETAIIAAGLMAGYSLANVNGTLTISKDVAGATAFDRSYTDGSGTVVIGLASPVDSFTAGDDIGEFTFDLVDGGPGSLQLPPISVSLATDTNVLVADKVVAALNAHADYGTYFDVADNGGGTLSTVTITRTLKGTPGTLSAVLSAVDKYAGIVNQSFTAASADGNLTVDVVDSLTAASIFSGGPLTVAVLGTDNPNQIAAKVRAVMFAAPLVTSGKETFSVLTDTVSCVRTLTGNLGTYVSAASFDAGTTGVSQNADVFTAGTNSRNIIIEADIAPGTNSFSLDILDSDITVEGVATKIANAINTDGVAGTILFAIANDASVVVYQIANTGPGSDTITLSVTDGNPASGVVATVAAQVIGIVGDSITLGTRSFEFVTTGLLAGGITVASGTGVALGADSTVTALSLQTAIGNVQVLTGEINAPDVKAGGVVLLESAIVGVAENVDISGESITGSLVVNGMAGGTLAKQSMLYVSGDELEVGAYTVCYQKLSVSCGPIVLIKQVVRNCDNTVKYTEMWPAVTTQAASDSLDEEADATVDFTLAVGVPGGSDQE